MLLEQMAARLKIAPEQLERESLRVFLERQLRLIESELFTLARTYGVQTVQELDAAVQAGRFHEPHVMFRGQRQGYPSPKSRFRFSGSVSG